MAYFFANQGSTYTILRDQGYIFTTPQDAHGNANRNYFELTNMLEGDKVIVNDNGFVAIGTVLSKNVNAQMEEDFAKAANDSERTLHWKKGKAGCRVEVKLDILDQKIRYQKYATDIKREQSDLPMNDRPFNQNGNANQSTFWYLTPGLGELLMEICGRRVPRSQSRLALPVAVTLPVPPVPYVAQFELREVRPEQSAFRKLMMETWSGICPISGTCHERLLEAAHFKNWRYHNDENAGMLLDVRVHAALDAGLLTISLDEFSNTWRVQVATEGWADLKDYNEKVFPNRIKLTR